jgi:hypothetical protein
MAELKWLRWLDEIESRWRLSSSRWRWLRLRHDGAVVEVELKMGILLRICLGGGGGDTAELQSSLLVEEFLSTRKILCDSDTLKYKGLKCKNGFTLAVRQVIRDGGSSEKKSLIDRNVQCMHARYVCWC